MQEVSDVCFVEPHFYKGSFFSLFLLYASPSTQRVTSPASIRKKSEDPKNDGSVWYSPRPVVQGEVVQGLAGPLAAGEMGTACHIAISELIDLFSYAP